MFFRKNGWMKFEVQLKKGNLNKVLQALEECPNVAKDPRIKDEILGSVAFFKEGFTTTDHNDLELLKLVLKLGAKPIVDNQNPLALLSAFSPFSFEAALVLIETGLKVTPVEMNALFLKCQAYIAEWNDEDQEAFQIKIRAVIKFIYLYLNHADSQHVQADFQKLFCRVNINFGPTAVPINICKIYNESIKAFNHSLALIMENVCDFPYVVALLTCDYLGYEENFNVDLKPENTKEFQASWRRLEQADYEHGQALDAKTNLESKQLTATRIPKNQRKKQWTKLILEIGKGNLPEIVELLNRYPVLVHDPKIKRELLQASIFISCTRLPTRADLTILKLFLKLGAKKIGNSNPLHFLSRISHRDLRATNLLVNTEGVSCDVMSSLSFNLLRSINFSDGVEAFQEKVRLIMKYLHLYMTNCHPKDADMVDEVFRENFSKFEVFPFSDHKSVQINLYEIYHEYMRDFYNLIYQMIQCPHVISLLLCSYLGGDIDMKPQNTKAFQRCLMKSEQSTTEFNADTQRRIQKIFEMLAVDRDAKAEQAMPNANSVFGMFPDYFDAEQDYFAYTGNTRFR